MNLARRLLAFGVENVNTLSVVTGLWLVWVGVAAFSRGAADIVLGAFFVACGAYPYLRRKGRN